MMSDTRPLSDRLQDMAGEVVMMSASLHMRLCRAAMEARRMERFADEIVSNAREEAALVARALERPL